MFLFLFLFFRDLRKTQEYLEVERVKVESRSRNMKFLKNKSKDFNTRIKAAEVDGRNYLTGFCDRLA